MRYKELVKQLRLSVESEDPRMFTIDMEAMAAAADAIEELEGRTPNTAIAMAYASGREAGLEEAAKVADEMASLLARLSKSQPDSGDDEYDHDVCAVIESDAVVAANIAAAIRQLKERT